MISFKDETLKAVSKVLDQMGTGLSDVVGYETAWVARVPDLANKSKPAFPLSLQWVRENQLEDGSWSQTPSPFTDTLNTLACVVTLADWNHPQDRQSILRGIEALERLSTKVRPDLEFKYVLYQFTLAKLVREARKFNLEIPYSEYERALGGLHHHISSVFPDLWKMHSKPTSLYCLECYDDDIDYLEVIKIMNKIAGKSSTDEEGREIFSGCISPSSTAFLLRAARLRNDDIPGAFNYLNIIYKRNTNGEMYCMFPIDGFELAFSLEYFWQGAFALDSELFKGAMEKLWKGTCEGQWIGFTTLFENFNDVDDTSLALFALKKAGYDVKLEKMMTFFNGEYFHTYHIEMRPALSANLNALKALLLFHPKESDLCKPLIKFFDKFTIPDECVFNPDKWSLSPYYATGRAVVCLSGIRDDIVNRCLNYFLRNQDADGGWNSMEESGYVVLALCHALRHGGYRIPTDVIEKCMKYFFLDDTKTGENLPPLWLGKTLYRPTLISDTVILSAKHALLNVFFCDGYPNFTIDVPKADGCLEKLTLLSVPSPGRKTGQTNGQTNGHTNGYAEPPKVQQEVVDKVKSFGSVPSDYVHKSGEAVHCLFENGLSERNSLVATYTMLFLILHEDTIKDARSSKSLVEGKVMCKAFDAFFDVVKFSKFDEGVIGRINYPNIVPLCRILLEMRSKLDVVPSNLVNAFEKYFDSCRELYVRSAGEQIDKKSLPADYLPLTSELTGIDILMELAQLFSGNVAVCNRNEVRSKRLINCFKRSVRLLSDLYSYLENTKSKRDNYNFVRLLLEAESNGGSFESIKKTIDLYNDLVTDLNILLLCESFDADFVNLVKQFHNGFLKWILKKSE